MRDGLLDATGSASKSTESSSRTGQTKLCWIGVSFFLGILVSLGFVLIGISLLGDGWMQLNEFCGCYFTLTSNVSF